MTEPALRVRKPVGGGARDTEGRRGCLLIGAALGIAVGTFVAFFLLPPIFGHFFGAADIELGKSYSSDGLTIRVLSAERQPGADGQLFPGVFLVKLEVMAITEWAPVGAEFELEVTGTDERFFPVSSDPALGGVFPKSNRVPLALTFAGTERRDALPLKLHLAKPNVRFHLQPGKPK